MNYPTNKLSRAPRNATQLIREHLKKLSSDGEPIDFQA